MESLGKETLTEIRKEAAAWLIEMDTEPQRWDRRQFVAWLKSSPRHMDEFLYQSALWRSLDDIDTSRIDVCQLLKESQNVVDWPQSGRNTEPVRGFPRTKRLRWVAGLAALGLAFLSVWLWSVRASWETRVLTTDIGEQRSVRLPDRSVVHLNTNSRVEIQFTDSAREIRLLRGEALFTVEHDVNRPFRVHTGDITVQAIGTQFNVRRAAADTLVSVIEGRVAVVPTASADEHSAVNVVGNISLDGSTEQKRAEQHAETGSQSGSSASETAGEGPKALTVAAGEQVRIAADGAVEQRAIEDLTSATAWRQRLLVFSGTPLSEVAAEVARYNVTPRLQIQGEVLGSRQLSGVFAADDPESLIQFLERDAELSVTRSGDVVVIKAQQKD